MRKKLIEIFTDWRTDKGLFGYFTGYDMPWIEASAKSLNIMYFGGRSGGKPISPLLQSLLNVRGELDPPERTELVDVIVNHFKQKWTRIYITTVIEYNPVENYNMVEDEKLLIDYGKKINLKLYKRGYETTTASGTTSTATDRSESDNGSDTSQIMGYNVPNSEFRDDTKTINTKLSEITDTQNVTDSNTTTQQHDTEDENNTIESGTDSHGKRLTRAGNIGVTSTQDLIKSEREIQIDFFTDYVFTDIDKILTLQLY